MSKVTGSVRLWVLSQELGKEPETNEREWIEKGSRAGEGAE